MSTSVYQAATSAGEIILLNDRDAKAGLCKARRTCDASSTGACAFVSL